MLKKTLKIASILFLSLFSFYYTNKSIELVKDQDPIMKEIKNSSSEYYVPAINAKIVDNTIIPGKTGKKIDYEETYNKMKQYGKYNEILTSLQDVKPTISVDNRYDKFIISGNPTKKSIALVFKIEQKNPKDIVDILESTKTPATFFIDGKYLEKNYQEVSNLTSFQLELLNDSNSYDEITFSSSKSYLESLTNKKLNFCYSEEKDEQMLKLCQKFKMHTIIPTILVKSNPYQEVKRQLSNSAIISLPISTQTEKELSTIIDYIKTRGYNFETLDTIINE